MTLLTRIARVGSACLIFVLAACGGGSASDHPPWYSISGAVTGLAAGTQLVLNNNGNDPLTVSSDGAFTFGKLVFLDERYAVTIAAPPTGQTCTVFNGSGSGVVADITTVTVVCSTKSYNVGVTVSGLAAGEQVTLKNNTDIANPLTVTFAQQGTLINFVTKVAYNSGYEVTVVTQPGAGKTCTVTNGSGSGVVADITSVVVTCSTNTFSIGGTVSGLAAGNQVTLDNNGADPVTVRADGAFTFATPVAYNSSFNVTVGTQPVGQTCTVSNGSGAGVVANIANVVVACSTNTFTIGVTVTGLTTGLTPDQQVTLLNGGNSLVVTASQNGTLRTFSTPVAYNGSYNVTVGTQPIDKTCTVSNGTGSGVVANVNNVTVTCSTLTFTIGGTVTGLAAGQQVTLLNNGANATIVAANGAYTFATPVAYSGSYAVTVGTQPTGQTCSVANGTSAGVTANVTNVNITCSTLTFAIGGTVTGLAAGQQVTLLNNGGNATVVTTNGAFTFSTRVPYGGSYAVTVGTQPTNQTCSISGATGSGSGVNADIATVALICSNNSYTIGGTVTGLVSGQTLTLLNNGADLKTITGTGSPVAFTFTTPVSYLGSYAVTVSTQPTNQTCSISGATGSGSGVNANVTTVALICSNRTYTIGGTVTGLAGGQILTLLNNGADSKTITGTGSPAAFTFDAPVSFLGSYAVTVSTQPTNQTCSISGATGSGSGVNANVTTVALTCSNRTYTIGGTVTGLASGQVLTLLNNGTDSKTISGTGSPVAFTFTAAVSYLGSYAVSVSTQPTNQTCGVSGATGSGSGVNANVTTVALTCSNNSYTIGGTVTGLASGQTLTLANGSDTKTITGVGSPVVFTFDAPVPYLGSYAVSVSTQPTNQTCGVSGATGSGSGVNANVTTVALTCSNNSYTIGGTVTGLANGQILTLLNNGVDSKTITGTGSPIAFTFTTPVPYLGSYAVTPSTQPTNQTCGVSGATGSGSGVNANVATVALTCSNNSYTIGGTVTGLASGQTLTLANGSDTKTITGTGSPIVFTFDAPVPYLGSYAVSVSTQPTNQTCGVSGATGSGSGVNANVTTVALTCSNNSYTIGGTVTGLASGQTLTLANGSDTKTITGVGSPVVFTFDAPVPYLGSYSVSVSTQPTDQTCDPSVATGSGSGVAADVTDVVVTCI